MKANPSIQDLLNLQQTEVLEVTELPDLNLALRIQSTAPGGICPICGIISMKVHDVTAEQSIRDLPVWGRVCWLNWRPRRYWCDRCKGTFVERVLWRESGFAYTIRFEKYIYELSRKESILEVARSEGLTESIVQGIFTRWAKCAIMERGYPEVRVLGVDEIAVRKGHGNYCLVIYAPELGIVLDVLKDRLKESLMKWLDDRGPAWRAKVETFSSDMWQPYHDAAMQKLPKAKRVADRFHVMKNLLESMSKARRAIQNKAAEAVQKVLKGCRWLLARNKAKLSAEQEEKLSQMFLESPELSDCYKLKEAFRNLLEKRITRKEAAAALADWIAMVEASAFDALKKFLVTVRNWREEIASITFTSPSELVRFAPSRLTR